MARYFPVFLDLENKPCLVVGAGEIATHKAAQLLKYGARLTIVAPEATEQVRQWSQSGDVTYHQRGFAPADVAGNLLVVGSTNSPEVNRQVYECASALGIWANIVDVTDLCSFIYGAIVERGDLQIAISTSGKSPAFAGHLRRELEHQFGEEYAQYLDILGQARQYVRETVGDLEEQKQLYSKLMELDLLALIRDGQVEQAKRKALECISQSSD